jgi:hypothetical protein
VGQYKREVREDQVNPRTGKPLRVWKRYPRGGSVEIPLKDGAIKPVAPDKLFPEIYIRGQARNRKTHWAVTLFLVNGQQEGRPKDESHVFQPELSVEAVDKGAIFCKRLSRAASGTEELEDQMMAMLYRRHVEFAVGHGVSVHAEVSDESPDQAVLVRTVVVPRYEVPRTTPPTAADADRNPAFATLQGLVLDMKDLAEADAKRLPKLLEPLVTAYRTWIDGEATRVSPCGRQRRGRPP